MNKKIVSMFVASLFAAASTAAFAMTKAEYGVAKNQFSADYKSAKAACNAMSANAKDICMAEAKGAEKVGKADLEARYTGKDKDKNKLMIAKAEAAYAVANQDGKERDHRCNG